MTPSEPLRNTRHERFVLSLLEGQSVTAAYETAGYKPDRKNAFRLSQKDDIRRRLNYLQVEAAKKSEITIESICAELDQAVEVANANKQSNAMVNAASLRARLAGLLTPTTKVEVDIHDERIRRNLQEAWPSLSAICEVMLKEMFGIVQPDAKLLAAFIELHLRQSDEMDELV